MSSPFKIVVFARVDPEQLAYLDREGCRVVELAEGDVDGVLRELRDADGAVAGVFVYFDDGVFAASPRLRVVGRVGVGVDNIDLDAATRHGVQVLNTPEPIIEPVAEHGMGLILALTRRIVVADRNIRSGRFRIESDAPGPELRGKTLGIVGFGNTGQRLAEIAQLGFGMRIAYFDLVDRPQAEERLEARRCPDLDSLLASSDVVSVHVSLNPGTRGLFGEAAFRAMRPSAYFVNCSRGPVVDEAALARALAEGWIAGAGLDVFCQEPPPADHPLLALENAVLTPHRAGQSPESRIGCSRVVEDILGTLRGEAPRNPVNVLDR